MPFLFVLLFASLIYSATHIIIPGTANIQAIADSALPNDTLLFKAGTYTVNLRLSRQLSLMGVPNGTVILKPQKDSAKIITITNYNVGFPVSVTIRNLQFRGDTLKHGIYLLGNPAALIDSCTFRGFLSAVHMAASTGSRISGCSFDSNSRGIVFSFSSSMMGSFDCKTCIITRNRFSNQTDCAIDLEHTGGLHTDNMITGNVFMQNQRCIRLITSQHTIITGNSFSDNINAPISMSVCMGGGKNNIIHHNAFVSGTIRPTDWAGRLYYHWYDSTARQGNYWADYSGRDADGDGVGDTPYQMGGQIGNTDSFPLMANPCTGQPVRTRQPILKNESASFAIKSIAVKSGYIIISTARPVTGTYRIFDALGRISRRGALSNQPQIVLNIAGENRNPAGPTVSYCEIRDGAQKAVCRLPFVPK